MQVHTALGPGLLASVPGAGIQLFALAKNATGIGHPRDQKVRADLDMFSTCNYATHMSKMVQLRNVPDALHRSLKARAALAGMSLSDYLIAEIREIAERPTLAELRSRLHTRKPIAGDLDTARLVREERDAR